MKKQGVFLGKRVMVSLMLCVCLLQTLSAQPAAAGSGSISAKSYILMEATTGRVVAAKNEQERMPIASTTKIMTALLTLEQPDLDSIFPVDNNAIKVEGSSMGLREGDKASLSALATGMLLSSGNDAANAAAVKLGGSVAGFAEKMNKRASELGMENSHFITPSGLHDEEHYSTAYDMALLTKTALQNPRFLSICSKQKVQVTFGNPPFPRWLYNHNRLLKEYSGCIGVKTGFTKKAGRCLVSAATRNGVTLICVTLSAPNDWQDHASLLDYGFSVVKPVELPVSTAELAVQVVGGREQTVAVTPLDKTFACVTEGDSLTQEVYLDRFYYAPLKKGEVVGEIRHLYKGGVVAVTDLIAAADTPAKSPPPQKKRTFMDDIKDFFAKHFRK